jgi:glutaredoxin
MIAIITAPGCGRCMTVKKILEDKGIAFKEYSIKTEAGQFLAEKAGVAAAGTLVDLETYRKVEVQDVISGA